ncbi:MAG TPA: amidohydrolase [Thermoanaerobacterales bacterium]|nr:amidohydrolase [Thermoanaerobacterales bacterium]
MKADLVVLQGSVITMDPSYPKVEGIAVKGEKILALGKNEEISNLIGPETKVLNAYGNTVLPGFIDCHVHFMQTGIDMQKVDLTNCKSLLQLKTIIDEQTDKASPGQWIMGTGYDEFSFAEKRLPTREELDESSPNKPVWLSRVDHHSCVVNSSAEKILNIPRDIEGIEKDPATGNTTGNLKGDANSYARQKINKLFDKKTRYNAAKKAAELMLSKGITTIHALEGGSLFYDDDVDILLDLKEELPIHVSLFYQTTDVKKVLDRGLKRIGGCLLIDGSLGSRTAALMESYTDAPGGKGILYFDDKELEEFVTEAHRKGLQITFHAIGDRGIEQVLKTYEKVLKKYPRPDHRHRIEHFCLTAPSQIERCVKAGIILSVQPAWVNYESTLGGMWASRLGNDRAKRISPLSSMVLSGAVICGGSDSPITPAGPLSGIHGGVNHFQKDESLSRKIMTSFFTTNAAYAGFEEKIKGRLAPGYLADIVILGADLFSVPDSGIADIPVATTIVQGGIKFSLNN